LSRRPNSELDLDTRLLSEFVYALNIARRQIRAYPAGHQIIDAALSRLVTLLPRLLEFRPELTIGIARDVLLVDDQTLNEKDPVYRDFAASLFQAGIAALTIRKTAEAAEFLEFFTTLWERNGQSPVGEEASRQAFFESEGIGALSIDYAAFTATETEAVHAPQLSLLEDESTVLWKSFVKGLVADTLDGDGAPFSAEGQIEPELLAEILNTRGKVQGEKFMRNYEQAITSFLQESDREQMHGQAYRETIGRLGVLVGKLKPELRRRFLNSTLKTCADHPENATELLAHLPQTTLLEALEQVNAEHLEIPQTLLDVLGMLARKGSEAVGASRISGIEGRSAAETTRLLGELFADDHSEAFVSEDYRRALAVLAQVDTPSRLDSGRVATLLTTLDGHAAEKQFCSVMLDLLERDIAAETTDTIRRNMQDLIFYFLETGDFESLADTYDHLARQAFPTDQGSGTPDPSAMQVYSSAEFIAAVIDGLDVWGKTKRASIKNLFRTIGKPVVDPILERLAVEEDRAKRRLLLECLRVMGTEALDGIVPRLHDHRWYFVRNLVILLRQMNEPAVLKHLNHLVDYAHTKVQFEVMRTFLHFGDSRAESYLLRELESKNTAKQIDAARLATNSPSGEVARKLAEVLNRKKLREDDAEVKSAVIKALAEMAHPEALPGLEKFLLSRNLLQTIQGNSLKIEAVKALQHYSEPSALSLAVRVRDKYSGELARTAGQVCLKLGGNRDER